VRIAAVSVALFAVAFLTSPPAEAAPGWVPTGSLIAARYVNTGILLHDGRVLVISGSPLVADTSERYDPATGTWSTVGPVGPTAGGRSDFAAVMLQDGRVLVAGGYLNSSPTTSCRLFDPIVGAWSGAGSLGIAREQHTATLLLDGRVLVSGGRDTSFNPVTSAEIYDPATDTWTPTGSLSVARNNHTATLLRDGKVMVTGGRTTGSFITKTTEVYDPGTGLWTQVGDMTVVRDTHSATMLPDGRVLAAGGQSSPSITATAELFDPGSGTWAATNPLPEPRFAHSATLLPSGKVLVAAGRAAGTYDTTRLYDPGSGTWSPGPNLLTGRYDHAATMLPDGRVLVTGGYDAAAVTTTELYDNDQPSWAPTAAMSSTRLDHTSTPLLDGRVLVVAGQSLNTAGVFDPTVPSWTPTPNLTNQRWRHSATLLLDGKVLVAGSRANTSSGRSAVLYNPAGNSWLAVPDMPMDRNAHSAVLLPCGEVLILGGVDSGSGSTTYLSVLRYNPVTNSWRTTASLSQGRFGLAATLLKDGRVFVSGGLNSVALDTATIYDPVSESWTPVPNPMTVARYFHTQTLLPSGKVLLVGGDISPGTAEIFDPATGTFTATGSPLMARDDDFTATLLPNGRVLVVGGTANPQTAEVYDPVSGTWTAVPDPLQPRRAHKTTLLVDGRVLVTGGVSADSTPEIYDVGRGEQAGWRPFLASVGSPLASGLPVTVTGIGFQGLGEGSTGLGRSQGATNYPLVQLRRIDNEEVRFLHVDPASGWTSMAFRSVPLMGWSDGPALVTTFTNGIPSVSLTSTVECPAPTIGTPPGDLDACAGGNVNLSVTASGGCALLYQWRKGGTPLVDGGQFSGTQTDTLQITGLLGSDAGSYDVVVSSACSSFASTSPPAVLTVSPALGAPVNVSVAGPSSVCASCTGGTASESHTGGGPVTYQWGYRTVSAGAITAFPGQTGPSYVINGADFPDVGSYFLVVTLTPLCGVPVVSQEQPIDVTSDPPVTDSVQFFTVTSRDGENVLEWVNAPGKDTVRIRFNTGTPCVFPSDPLSSGTLLMDKTGLPGQRDGLSHSPIANGTTYCYTMWTDLGGGTYSAGESNHGRPFDTSGPVKWAFSTGVFSITAPTVGSAAVIATSNGGALHATLRGPAGGTWPLAWLPVPIGGPVQSRSPIVPIDVGPIPSNPVVFLGSQDGAVYSVDGAQGGAVAFPWVPTGIASTVQAAPAGIFSDFGSPLDYLLVGTRDSSSPNALVALDPLSGTFVDKFDNSAAIPPNEIGIISGTASVDYATKRVVFTSRAGTSGNTLWCLQLDKSPNPTFTLLWARALGDIDSSPIVRGDRVYVGTSASGGTLYSIDAASGAAFLDRTWVHGDGPVRGFVWPDRFTDDLYFATDTLVHGVSDTAGGITPNFASISLGGGVTPSPVLLAPGTTLLYVGGSDGKLYEIDVAAGPGIKSVTLGDGLATVGAPSLDVGFDLVHVGTEAGIFYAVALGLP